MLLPLTLGIPVEQAFAFMVSLYCANHLAGGVPAILVKIPDSGGAAATTLDGYPMTQKGQAQQAIVLVHRLGVRRPDHHPGHARPPAVAVADRAVSALGRDGRRHALRFDPHRGHRRQGHAEGLISGLFGLLIGVIGTDHIYNAPRATFGFLELYDGVPLVAALIGLFAVSEALVMIEEKLIVAVRDANGQCARAGPIRSKGCT